MFITMIKFCYIYIFFSLSSLSFVSAQENDAQLWTKVTVSKKIGQQSEIQIDACTRFGNNVSNLNTFYFQISDEFKINKWFRIGIAYRYAEKDNLEDHYDTRNRINLFAILRKKFLKTVSVQYRTQFQSQMTNIYTSENGKNITNFFRNKLNLSFDLNKKYTPYISTELYYRFKFENNNFSKVRYVAGIDYELSKKHQIGAYYLIQNDLNVSNPNTSFVTGLSYHFNL